MTVSNDNTEFIFTLIQVLLASYSGLICLIVFHAWHGILSRSKYV